MVVKRVEPKPQPALRDCILNGLSLRAAPAPGLRRQTCPTMAQELLARHAEIEPGERVVIAPSGNGVLGVWVAHLSEQNVVHCYDTSIVATHTVQRTLSANRCGRMRTATSLPDEAAGPYDVAMMTLPKGRDLARLLVLSLARSLRPQGRLYLAGPNDGGIKSIIDDAAELLGAAEVLAYKGGNRVVRFAKPDELPTDLPAIYQTPGVAVGSYRNLKVTVANEAFDLQTRPGVFSWRELDAGTAMLLENLIVHPHDIALDLGCGYGLIGMFMARRSEREVTLIDDDFLACDCAERNLVADGSFNARVLLNDGLEGLGRERFTLIVTNPPFHSGQEVSSKTTERWMHLAYTHLEPRGRIVLVANRFLPYDHVLKAVFGSCEVLAETTRFRVLQAVKVYRKRGQPEAVATVDEWEDDQEELELPSPKL
ncbi:MAG: methyltransferase [Anaerolineae bacterium]